MEMIDAPPAGTPIGDAWRRMMANSQALGADSSSHELGRDVKKGRSRDGAENLVRSYGLEPRDVDEFAATSTNTFAVAVNHGAHYADAIASLLVATLLVGIEIGRDPRAR